MISYASVVKQRRILLEVVPTLDLQLNAITGDISNRGMVYLILDQIFQMFDLERGVGVDGELLIGVGHLNSDG